MLVCAGGGEGAGVLMTIPKTTLISVGLSSCSLAVSCRREDINSVLMTAMQGLLDKYGIDPARIGRLEVRKKRAGLRTAACSVEEKICVES